MVESRRRNPNNPHIEVVFLNYRIHHGRDKFKFDYTDSKWIDVDCVVSIVSMSYNSTNEVSTLDRNDSEQVCDISNYIGFMTKPNSSLSISYYVSVVHYVFGLH